ncbi:phage protein GemA/Gp16 family protein [Pseudazoarcus pumilus]|uniref:GemA protein n=1 Tax=Pseudazoarcus pumilus TaxID=2067960 RepID=A0A2I6S9G8_9RHOO|nr:phage protein GemA/Gp16 family protein [Pseudazoarcus pumilus]AUN95895.1 hypothetical protein C0099_13715 [Pseudazoarcus pumilus]
MAAHAPESVRIAARRRAIFAACRAAGIDDAMRRDIVRRVADRTSLTECSLVELGAVLNYLNQTQQGYAGRRRVTPAKDRAPLLGKIDALLAELHRVTGEPHTLKYADAIARRNGWAENIDFADATALHKIIGALNRTLQYKIAGD